MSSKPLNVVIVSCGSFNPITVAHIGMLRAAKAAIEALPGAPRKVVQAFVSPVNDGYKKEGLAPFPLRREICNAAFAAGTEHDWISLHEWEGQQTAFVPTFIVMKKIWDELKERGVAVDEQYFVCGGDLLESFYKPGAWGLANLKRLVEEFKLVVISRPGSPDAREFILKSGVITNEEKFPGVVVDCAANIDHFIFATIGGSSEGLDVSSTKVRTLLRDEGADALARSGMVPAACMGILAKQDFYAVKKSE
jgi:nicotinamide mononucleotide adenylyltransferase